MDGGTWQAAVHGVAKSPTRLSDFTFTFHFHALEKKMATYSSVLAWRIPGMGEPGGLPSLGSHRVGHYKRLSSSSSSSSKGVKTKIRVWLPSEKQVYTEGTGGFSSPGGLMTVNLLCQQNTFFQFSYQMKARVKTDGELIQLAHILLWEAKVQYAERWGCRIGGLKMGERGQNGISMVQPHILTNNPMELKTRFQIKY